MLHAEHTAGENPSAIRRSVLIGTTPYGDSDVMIRQTHVQDGKAVAPG